MLSPCELDKVRRCYLSSKDTLCSFEGIHSGLFGAGIVVGPTSLERILAQTYLGRSNPFPCIKKNVVASPLGPAAANSPETMSLRDWEAVCSAAAASNSPGENDHDTSSRVAALEGLLRCSELSSSPTSTSSSLSWTALHKALDQFGLRLPDTYEIVSSASPKEALTRLLSGGGGDDEVEPVAAGSMRRKNATLLDRHDPIHRKARGRITLGECSAKGGAALENAAANGGAATSGMPMDDLFDLKSAAFFDSSARDSIAWAHDNAADAAYDVDAPAAFPLQQLRAARDARARVHAEAMARVWAMSELHKVSAKMEEIAAERRREEQKLLARRNARRVKSPNFALPDIRQRVQSIIREASLRTNSVSSPRQLNSKTCSLKGDGDHHHPSQKLDIIGSDDVPTSPNDEGSSDACKRQTLQRSPHRHEKVVAPFIRRRMPASIQIAGFDGRPKASSSRPPQLRSFSPSLPRACPTGAVANFQCLHVDTLADRWLS